MKVETKQILTQCIIIQTIKEQDIPYTREHVDYAVITLWQQLISYPIITSP